MWTAAKSFLHGCQNWSKCPEDTKLRKIFSEKGKFLLIFWRFWENSLFYSGRKIRQNCRNCNVRSLGRLWGKKCLKPCTLFQFSLDFESKNTSFLRKISFRVLTNVIRASRGMFCGKSIPFTDRTLFFVWIFELHRFFRPLANRLSRWVKTAMHVSRWKYFENLLWKNVFFKLFGPWVEKLVFLRQK